MIHSRFRALALAFSFILVCLTSIAQPPSVGLRQFSEEASTGFTLISPEANDNVYLIDRCGEVINTWTFNERVGLTSYILENGNILRAGIDSLQIRNWDNEVVWSYNITAAGFNQHHDIEPLPNGNILCLVFDELTVAEATEEGRDPSLSPLGVKLDKIVEIQPDGTDNAIVIWEWKFRDHLIQDFDSTKSNFGVPQDHPELLDINFSNGHPRDFTHCNSIDYNADLDQILLSARHMNEIYIIDHSTSTIQAAGHTGGNSGAGGDFIWRWGNPMAYGPFSPVDQLLFKQHDAQWVPNGYNDAGKISVFNNGGNGFDNASTIHLIDIEVVNGGYEIDNDAYLPNEFHFSWGGDILGETLFEGKKSGVQSLPNGNMLITESGIGQITEVTQDSVQVWTYQNPHGLTVLSQSQDPVGGGTGFFRAAQYPSDYVGFNGQDLTRNGLIEDVNGLSSACRVVGIEDDAFLNTVGLQNPIYHGQLNFTQSFQAEQISLIDLRGKTVLEVTNFEGQNLNIDVIPAIYFLQIRKGSNIKNQKVIVY